MYRSKSVQVILLAAMAGVCVLLAGCPQPTPPTGALDGKWQNVPMGGVTQEYEFVESEWLEDRWTYRYTMVTELTHQYCSDEACLVSHTDGFIHVETTAELSGTYVVDNTRFPAWIDMTVTRISYDQSKSYCTHGYPDPYGSVAGLLNTGKLNALSVFQGMFDDLQGLTVLGCYSLRNDGLLDIYCMFPSAAVRADQRQVYFPYLVSTFSPV